jgi:hypothetical protein
MESKVKGWKLIQATNPLSKKTTEAYAHQFNIGLELLHDLPSFL